MDDKLKNLLEELHKRPGVYIGRKSLEKLLNFVYGYIHCMYEYSGTNPVFLHGFQQFIEEYYDLQDNTHVFRNWSEIISFFNATEEEAFDEFYRLVDVFLEADHANS
ncbi:MAG: hypothetical protein LBS74_03190 [Oscillospiraceae bacterium]|jgi:hypothetical protein|nr:hypothetical protein [Oscillospiraceae bacterium]